MSEVIDAVEAVVEDVVMSEGGEVIDVTGLLPGEFSGPEEGPYPDFPEEAEAESQPVDYEQLAMRVAAAIQRVYQMGDQVALLLVNPALLEGLKTAFMALPDETVPRVFKEQLPMEPDEEVGDVRIITGTDVEAEFLQQYLGPQGNGFLPRLQQYMQMQRHPVKITLDALRMFYLMDVKDRIAPGIIRPPVGAQILQGPPRR